MPKNQANIQKVKTSFFCSWQRSVLRCSNNNSRTHFYIDAVAIQNGRQRDVSQDAESN